LALRFLDQIVRTMLRIQGVYFLITGIWPVLHIESFMWVTGPKVEIWLVKTLGLMFACMGLGFLTWKHFGKRDLILPFSCALCLAAIDIHYWANGTISAVYLADAALELLFGSYWGWQMAGRRRKNDTN
jgi:hypothetical protein